MRSLSESDLKSFQAAIYKDYGIMLEDTVLYQEAFNLLQFVEALIKFDREDKKKAKEKNKRRTERFESRPSEHLDYTHGF